MGVSYLWDTNTAIYFLQRLFPQAAEQFIDGILAQSFPVISAITEIELLCWKNASPKDTQVLHSFIADTYVIELEPAIKLKAAELRKQYSIKLPDAIIAATALVYNLTVLTRNTTDFTKIIGLKTENPWIK